ncbi:MAG: DeoR/GlpR transcriptional regulator [Clostridiales bacterium]|nr:DeoR/GlpR transcriptional regulator [Clostridiales bacterium]
MKSNRIEEMLAYINNNFLVSMEELCQHFDVSLSTVRRDVAQLQKAGKISKVYGGVQSTQEKELIAYHARKVQNEKAKSLIGRLAANYVKDGDVIFIDSGTTTREMVSHLADRQNLVIITHSLTVINEASLLPNATVIVLPGILNRQTGSFTGSITTNELGGYNITTAFMAASGYSLHGQVTNSSMEEFEIKQAAVQQCKQRILLLDGSKFGKNGLLTYANINEFSHLISNEKPPAIYSDALAKAKVSLIVADGDK